MTTYTLIAVALLVWLAVYAAWRWRRRDWVALYVIEERYWLWWRPVYGGQTAQRVKQRFQQHRRDERFRGRRLRVRVVKRVPPEDADAEERRLIAKLVERHGERIENRMHRR